MCCVFMWKKIILEMRHSKSTIEEEIPGILEVMEWELVPYLWVLIGV